MPDKLTITILLDNKAGDDLVAEHGLSLWIEYQGTRILFDTGQSGAFLDNAQKLGIDMPHADILVLSHGHYDHTGGIPGVLDHNDHIDVYAHPDILKRRYSIRDRTVKSIGIPKQSSACIEHYPPARLHWVTDKTMLTDRIGLTGPIPRTTIYENTGGPFYLDESGQQKDPIEDDQALWIDNGQGLVVCMGCGHSGLINTLDCICRLTGKRDISAVIGGFHLNSANTDRLNKTVAALKTFAPKNIIPCHCTGDYATRFMEQRMGDSVLKSQSGQVYRF